MNVRIINYSQQNGNFVEYKVSGLTDNQINYLNDNLNEETIISDEDILIKMYFTDELYPFQSEVAKFRIDDFISREEIEMNIYLSSVLEDM